MSDLLISNAKISMNVRRFVMYRRGLTYFEQHFFFSSRPVKIFFRIYPNQNLCNQMFVLCVVMVHILPLILHQFYQVYMLDMKMKSTLKILQLMTPALQFLCFYVIASFSLTKVCIIVLIKLLFAHIKLDYEFVRNEEELNVMEKYINKNKLYVHLLVCRYNKIPTSISNCKMILQLSTFLYCYMSPSIINVFLYIFGTWDGILLTLPYPIHNVLQAGLLYYSLLIYQIITAFITITMGIICYSVYWALMFHAFGQFNIIMKEYLFLFLSNNICRRNMIRQPFKRDQRHTQKYCYSRTPQEEFDWMIDIIKCHRRVTELMFQLFNEMLNTREVTEGFVYMVVFLSTLYINFYMGQLLINYSNAVFTELCNIPFYILSIKTQKMLLLLLTRSIKPSVISIGGIFVTSHKVLAAVRNSIVQKAFSFAMIIYLFEIFFAMIFVFDFLYIIKEPFLIVYILSYDIFKIFQLSKILLNISKTIEYGVCIAGFLFTICQISFHIKIPYKIIEKLLLFMFTRSMRPCHFSIIDMFVASHKSFAKNMEYSFPHNVGERPNLLRTTLSFFKSISTIIDWFTTYSQFEQAVVSNSVIDTYVIIIILIIIVIIIIIIVVVFYQLYTSDVTLYSAIKVLQNMLASLCFVITYSTIFFNYETVRMIHFTLSTIFIYPENIINYIEKTFYFQMKSVYAHFKFDYVQLSDENELKIFRKYTKQSKICTYSFIDNSQLKLPFSINGVTNPGALYYSLLIYQIIAIYIIITIANVCFTSYLIFVQHACCQLSILKFKICQPFLNKKTYSQKIWLNKKDEEFDWIVDIIIRHRRVTKFIYLLNYMSKITYIIAVSFGMFLMILNLLNVSNFFDISYGSIMEVGQSVIFIFQMDAILRNIGELIECSFYIVASLFNLYINFYIGQTLINHSNAAFEELCQVPFYTLSTKTQKLLLTITLRSMKPCVLSIGANGKSIFFRDVFARSQLYKSNKYITKIKGCILLTLLRMSFQFESVRYSTLLTSVENNHLLPYLQTLSYFQAVDNIFLKREAMYERSIDSIIKSVGFVTHLEIEYGRLFTMSIIGMSYYDKHFFFSNRLVKLLIGLKPSQSANKQLLLFCLITVYIFPMIAQQFYQLYTSDVTLHSATKLVQNMLTVLCFLITYSFIYFNFETVRMMYFTLTNIFINARKTFYFQTRLIFAHFKFDYGQLSDKNVLNIFEQYTKQCKIYTYIFVDSNLIFSLIVLAALNFYFIATVSPCIFNLFLYIFGTLDKVDLKLPVPISNVSSRRTLYFSLLIYQTIAIYLLIIIASVCYTSYLIFIQHACCQLSILKYVFNVETTLKIRQPFLNKKYNQVARLNKKEADFDWIVNIIIRHRRITKFVDYLNNFSEVNYLICTFAGMFIIMLDFLNIFRLATLMRNTSELIKSASYIVCSLFVVYINFYFGQTLINHSHAAFIELIFYIYNLNIYNLKDILYSESLNNLFTNRMLVCRCQVPFYTLSVTTQKLLLLVIARSRKQCVLSIGGVFVSSHEVFLELMQKAFSFAMYSVTTNYLFSNEENMRLISISIKNFILSKRNNIYSYLLSIKESLNIKIMKKHFLI
ncbi:hypothetical protein V1478_015620 [Vespula squamosa]|uniref:Uncharacterized protein n=1 Tax=Vespula squamosa TaxID=30214 RepID=A0ABD2A1E3_VESSQ